MPQEILIDSLSVSPQGVRVSRALQSGGIDPHLPYHPIIRDRVKGFHLTGDPSVLTPENMVTLLTSAYGLRINVNPQNIPSQEYQVDERDQVFAQQFGYSIRPLASSHIASEGYLAAWIGPTLVHKDHPLASARGNHLHIEASEGGSFLTTSRDVLLHRNQIFAAHYVRLTVLDEPLVLAQVTGELAKEIINICEVRQPEQKKAEPAEIAFLLDPCEAERVNAAVLKISQLTACLAVNAVFKVLGNPTQDISRQYLKS